MYVIYLYRESQKVATFSGTPETTTEPTEFWVMLNFYSIEMFNDFMSRYRDFLGNTIQFSQPTYTSWVRLYSCLLLLPEPWSVIVKEDKHPPKGKLDIPEGALP